MIFQVNVQAMNPAVVSFVDTCMQAMEGGRIFFCCAGAVCKGTGGHYYIGEIPVTREDARNALLCYYRDNHSSYQVDYEYMKARA